MNLEQAKQAVGSMVMAHDSRKLSKGPHPPHGPYRLLRVTKGGMCILDRDPNRFGSVSVPPRLISLAEPLKEGPTQKTEGTERKD